MLIYKINHIKSKNNSTIKRKKINIKETFLNSKSSLLYTDSGLIAQTGRALR